MRKVIESTLVSLDGVIGDPMVWANEYFDEEAVATSLAQLRVSDAMLMGRTTHELFAAAWPSATGDYAEAMNAITKYVFSGTLAEATWTNTTIVGGDVPTAVRELKQHGDGDLVLYGHGPLGQALLEDGLLDELRLWIHPLFVGHGNRLSRPDVTARLRLVGTETRANGVVVVTYELERFAGR
jgi:dihydrofolate reductase